MAQAYSQCQRFLSQGAFAAPHLLNNLCDWRFSLRVLLEQLDIGGCVEFARPLFLFCFLHLLLLAFRTLGIAHQVAHTTDVFRPKPGVLLTREYWPAYWQ